MGMGMMSRGVVGLVMDGIELDSSGIECDGNQALSLIGYLLPFLHFLFRGAIEVHWESNTPGPLRRSPFLLCCKVCPDFGGR